MSEYGINEEGFNLKPFEAIRADLVTSVKGVFGEDVNLNPETLDGQRIDIDAEKETFLWQQLQLSYNASNPAAVTGIAQDNLVAINGLTRLDEAATIVTVDLTGDPATVIHAGSIVASDSGNQFTTDIDVTLDGGGLGSVNVTATVMGAVEALSGTVTTIVTPVVGWDTVNNPSDATPGRLRESNTELRIRRNGSVAGPSQTMKESIFSGVAALDGMQDVLVEENFTGSVGGNGIPSKAFETVVLGGNSQEIADEISLRKAIGIEAHGGTIVESIDSQGRPTDIGFTRAGSVNIYIDMDITTNSDFPADGEEQIKQALVDYGDEFLSIDDDVVYSRLFTPINSVPGHSINSLFIGASPAPLGTSNLPIAFNQVSNFNINFITIGV